MRLWIVLLLAGCAGNAGPSDGGDRADRPRVPLVAPDPPALPMIAPCPDGWREVSGPEGVTQCDPWPESGRADCPDGQAHFPGTPGCATVGTACPADGWPADLPTDRPIRYVANGAPAGGDGLSTARPFATVAAALAASPADTIIALAAGRYDEIVALSQGRSLWGACPAQTFVTSSVPDSNATVIGLVSPGAGLRNLTVDAPERSGVAITQPGTTIDDVIVRGARVVGISVSFGSVTARGLVIEGTRPRVEDGRFGNGLSIAAGTTVTLERAVLEGNRNGAIALSGPSAVLDARAVAISGTLGEEADDRFGHAVVSIGGATAQLEESVLEENATQAIYADGNGARVELRRSVIRGTLAQASDSTFGRGADIVRSAALVLERTVVDANATGGLYASDASLALTDTVISGSLAQPSDDRFGMGIFVEEEATVSIQRVLLAANRTAGVLASGSAITGEDLTIADTAEQVSDLRYGRGVHVANGSTFDLTRLAILRSREAAMSVVGAGSTANVAHVSIADVREQAAGAFFGVGISIEAGASMTLDVARIERVIVFGARASNGTLTATELAILSIGENTSGGGFGLVAEDGSIDVDHFAISDATECAYLIGAGADVDLARGDVADTNVGACIQVDGYDANRLHDDVVYQGAAAQRDTAHLLPAPLPEIYE